MKLKNEIEYVFRILNYLSLNTNRDRIVTSNEIAEQENIPHLFSIRVLKKMEKKGLLKIYKGASGGYKLKKEPEEITLKDAVETIETEIIIKDKELALCNNKNSCPVIYDVLEKVENNFLKNLENYNFKDLTAPNFKNPKSSKINIEENI